MSQNISVTFCPIDEGIVEKKLILACDTTKLNYILRGEQIKVDIIIKSLDGLDMVKSNIELSKENEEKNIIEKEKKTYIDDSSEEEKKYEEIDLSNKIKEKEEKLENLFFEDTYPFSSSKRILVLKNISQNFLMSFHSFYTLILLFLRQHLLFLFYLEYYSLIEKLPQHRKLLIKE